MADDVMQPPDTTVEISAVLSDDHHNCPSCCAKNDPGLIARSMIELDRQRLTEAGWTVAPVVKMTAEEWLNFQTKVLLSSAGLLVELRRLGLPIEVTE